MNPFWRGALVTARHELVDLMRSRRIAVILFLYVAGVMLACHGFTSVLRRLETQLTETLNLPASTSAGTVTDALWRSTAFRRMMSRLVGDRQVALELLSVPPIALIYAWLAFTFTPLFVLLSSSPRITEEIESGAVRFVLVRISRFSWCAGKFLGQSLEVLLAVTLGALGVWCVARLEMAGVGDPAVVSAMIVYAWRAWLYCLAFVGLGLCISQIARPTYLAMGIGFAAWVALSVLWVAARHFAGDGIREIWELAAMLIPMGHRLDMWRTDWRHVLQAEVFLTALAASYFVAGYARFSRKDL